MFVVVFVVIVVIASLLHVPLSSNAHTLSLFTPASPLFYRIRWRLSLPCPSFFVVHSFFPKETGSFSYKSKYLEEMGIPVRIGSNMKKPTKTMSRLLKMSSWIMETTKMRLSSLFLFLFLLLLWILLLLLLLLLLNDS